MMKNEDSVPQFWQAYLSTLPSDHPARHETYIAESFGDNPTLADELAALIVAGVKTATCSCLWEWQAEGEQPPSPGQKTIVLDGQGRPAALIETTTVIIQPYNQVDAAFAAAEGEGDQSLAYWRAAHWRYFSRALPKIGCEPTESMPLVCEQFRLLYRRQP